MTESAPISFDSLRADHADILKSQPVEHDLLMGSLRKLRETGTALVRSEDLGTIRYADYMTAENAVALALNDGGNVQPPLSNEEIAELQAENSSLEVILHANGDTTDVKDKPTDTNTIPTAGRKGQK